MTKGEATRLLRIYGEAWEKRDADLILTIFTEDASYNDPKEPENFGHAGIKNYWIKKVQGEQKDIRFTLLNVWIDGDTVVAEWHADFIDIPRNFRISMDEVAIFAVRGDKFSSLREYYKSTKLPL
ncbi:MAG TPA: nuclear transport factor 2 family protein [Candidatus Paceibacterota bacterium]|jgi:ketosteroid isomerase-like protein|nr:nuclear transport factor 2 family protein [Candidatus Paceibacterota bacterium]